MSVLGRIVLQCFFYYYQKKDSSLETSINKEGPDEITSKDGIVQYKITYNAIVKDYIGNATITIIDTLPYKIDEELINRTKELQTDTITIQTEDTIVNTRSIESLKHIVETNDDIGEREIAFTINFNKLLK